MKWGVNTRIDEKEACLIKHLDAVCSHGAGVSEVGHERNFPPAGDVRSIQSPREVELLPPCICCCFRTWRWCYDDGDGGCRRKAAGARRGPGRYTKSRFVEGGDGTGSSYTRISSGQQRTTSSIVYARGKAHKQGFCICILLDYSSPAVFSARNDPTNVQSPLRACFLVVQHSTRSCRRSRKRKGVTACRSTCVPKRCNMLEGTKTCGRRFRAYYTAYFHVTTDSRRCCHRYVKQ